MKKNSTFEKDNENEESTTVTSPTSSLPGLATSSTSPHSILPAFTAMPRNFTSPNSFSSQNIQLQTQNTDPLPFTWVDFFNEYFGHKVNHLHLLLPKLLSFSTKSPRRAIYLAGDSSLDSKEWIVDTAPGANGYAEAGISRCKRDVCYEINSELVRRGLSQEWFAINGAVEASTLSDRRDNKLWKHDEWIRDSIQPGDVLVVSVGGNDIALRPSLATTAAMLSLIHLAPLSHLEACAQPGSSPGCALGVLGLNHFIWLFKNQVEDYISRLTSKTKPSLVLCCMIYYPDVTSNGYSWAVPALNALRYNSQPEKLQTAIRAVFVQATCQIQIPGVDVVPVPFFSVLDGKDPADYVARVEPSIIGGAKLGRLVLDSMFGALPRNKPSTNMHTNALLATY